MEDLKKEIKTAGNTVEAAANSVEAAANSVEAAANSVEATIGSVEATATAQGTKKERKPKKAKTALLLALFFGEFGFDRIYLGYWILGILKFLTLGGLGIWWVYDVAKIASLQMKDRHGNPLKLN